MTATPSAPMTTPRAATLARLAAGRALLASTRAELLRFRHWPVPWLLLATWLGLQTTFGFVIPYIAYRGGDDSSRFGGSSAQLLAGMSPDAAPSLLVQGTPLFGGALVLILAALATGSGFAWGTWKTTLTLGPGRRTALGGTVLAVAVAVLATVLATVGVVLVAANLVMLLEGQPTGLPDLADTTEAAAGAALILGMWVAGGIALGVLTRSPALGTGLGLVWTLVVENLLRGSAGLLDWLSPVTDHLPGTAAGSLAGALGAAADPGAAPGVLTVLTAPAATLTLAAYLVAFLAVAFTVFARRDVP